MCLKSVYRAVASTGGVVRRKGVERFASEKFFLPLIELNTSVPQEGCLHHCCSLHGKPLSVSNSETSQQELFVGEPCCFSPFLCSIKPISQRLAVTPHACSSIMHCFNPITYRIRFNFRGVKLSRIADFSNFRVFIFADAGSYLSL